MPSRPLHTIVETREFISDAKRLLSELECWALINAIASDPLQGILMEGTGGARKLRWARPGRGKSGGLRVVYYHHSKSVPVFLLSIFAKNEKINLSRAEQNELAKTLKKAVKEYRKRGQRNVQSRKQAD